MGLRYPCGEHQPTTGDPDGVQHSFHSVPALLLQPHASLLTTAAPSTAGTLHLLTVLARPTLVLVTRSLLLLWQRVHGRDPSIARSWHVRPSALFTFTASSLSSGYPRSSGQFVVMPTSCSALVDPFLAMSETLPPPTTDVYFSHYRFLVLRHKGLSLHAVGSSSATAGSTLSRSSKWGPAGRYVAAAQWLRTGLSGRGLVPARLLLRGSPAALREQASDRHAPLPAAASGLQQAAPRVLSFGEVRGLLAKAR
ncbi:hypothetical protein J2853_005005 [Streptosporangium lutulentum]|uniref:Uncharacterized protein n=1 Tax=Streptosporangium lutulentum TaxID=1461250 RepID=A0ABT9QI97_9ACTN|nr:hypothetical protein [Streptosporangium lutulentum]